MAGEQRNTDTSSNTLTFIHAPDSLLWARFLQTKLLTDNYNIPSSLHPPYLPPDFFSPSSSSPSSSPSSSSHRRLSALIVSPDLLEPNHSDFWASYVKQQRGPSLVIFLGVQKEDLIKELGKSLSSQVLARPWVEVVDRERSTVSLALVKLIEMYEAAERSRLRGSLAQESFEEEEEEEEEGEFEEEEAEEEEKEDEEEEEKLERMKKYEDEEGDESPYFEPPPPRQQNDIMKVMPAVLYEGVGGREVVVVMRREAEKELRMVVQSHKDGAPLHNLTLEHLASSAYVVTMPNDVHGRVAFRILSGGHTIGGASVYICSRLDVLHTLLGREISPLPLLCKAAGLAEAETTTATTVPSSKIEELDKVLARRLSLSQLPPGLLGLFNAEELEGSAEQEPEYTSQSQWPTLLHFAAEFNLVRVCDALLEYPGMLHAACTENVQGLFPCMLAERRGFKSLHSCLVQYVEEMSTRGGQHKRSADSGVSFPPETAPPPKPHGSHSPSYVNQGHRSTAADRQATDPEAEDNLDSMGMMYASSKKRSFSEGCVRTCFLRPPSEDRIAEEEDGFDTPTSPPPINPKLARARSTINERSLPVTHNPPLPPRPPGHSQRQQHFQTSPQQTNSQMINSQMINSQKSNPEPNVPHSATWREGAAAEAEERGKEGDVTSAAPYWRAQNLDENRRLSSSSSKSSQQEFETLTEEGETVLRYKTKRSKSLQEKLSHFFHKMKPRSNRSSSETNLAALGRTQKKTTVYVRASTASTGSDPTNYCSWSLQPSQTPWRMENERDSGAVCEEKSSRTEVRRGGHTWNETDRGEERGTHLE
ncbi:hypothetical protein ACOMHN_021984 [Nucella lapillus]